MQLEEELKVQLFIRSKSKIVLTDKGMLLRRRAEEIVGLAEKTENEFSNYEDIIAGEIFIGSGETNSMHSLAKVMKDFHDLYPQVQYNLYSANADDIKEKIDKGLIDIGLLTEPVDISKYDFVRLKEKEVWGVLMRKDDVLASKDYVTADDLIDKPLTGTVIVWKKHQIFSSATTKFIEEIKSAFKEK